MNLFKATNLTMTMANSVAMFLAVPFIGAFAWTGEWLLLGICLAVWQLFNIVGIAAGAHRYFSHYAFKTSAFWEWTMAYFCMVALVGPPCIWADAHVKHHFFSDTDEDPYLKWTLTGGSPFTHTTSPSVGFVAKWSRKSTLHRYSLKYYWLFVLSWIVLCAALGALLAHPVLGVLVGWVIPTGLSQLTLRLVLWTGHLPWLGYRNHETRDKSNNIWWMSLISGSEGWHNNHHYKPGAANTRSRWWEFDITWWFIKAIRK